MPFRIFRVSTVAGANVAGLLLGAVVFANFFILTLYVQDVLGWSALKTGVTFIATAGIGDSVGRAWRRRSSTRIGAKIVMAIGFVAMIAASLVHADTGRTRRTGATCCPATCCRIRAAVRVHPGLDRCARRRRVDEAGLASGLINTAQQIGGAIGVAVTSSVAISHFNHLVSTGTSAPAALTSGYQWAFWVMVGVGIIGLIATITLIRSDQLQPAPEPVSATA